MNIVIDPDGAQRGELRRTLYARALGHPYRLQALRNFDDYTREKLAELFKP
jgi:hypothetical protein